MSPARNRRRAQPGRRQRKHAGCEDDEVKNTDTLTDVFRELDRRSSICGAAYPFAVQSNGEVLQHSTVNPANVGQIVYRYLLLGTRLNMLKQRVHAKHDGTCLFEEFSAAALKAYLGNDKAQSLVFGTSVGGGFGDKVKVLCARLAKGAPIDPLMLADQQRMMANSTPSPGFHLPTSAKDR